MRREEELLGEAKVNLPEGHSIIASAQQPNDELPGEAIAAAPQGHASPASSRQPKSNDAGQQIGAGNGRCPAAPSLLPNEDEEGHCPAAFEGHDLVAPSSSPNEDAAAAKAGPFGAVSVAAASSPDGDEAGHGYCASLGQNGCAPSSPTVFDLIRYHHRQRNYVMEMRKSTDLKLGAFLRTVLGWTLDKTPTERARIQAQAQALIEIGEREAKGKAADTDEPAYAEWRNIITASIAARAPFDAIEKRMTKEMERLAETLPVWGSFGKAIKGFGPRSLAVIIGEAGDLSQYSNHSKLWKRMGVAVIDGKRQGGLSKSASADDWIAHGYNRQRRARLFVIGDVLVKFQSRYRDIYLARKEYERAKAEAAGLTVAAAAKIPKKRAAEFMSLGHIDKRARRYMEKKLLRDLFNAWKREGHRMIASEGPGSHALSFPPDGGAAISSTPVIKARISVPRPHTDISAT